MSTGELAEKLAEEKLEEERKLEGQEPKVSMTAEQIAAKKKRHETELAAEKAEVWQSISALYIPLSLFLSCVSFSAGAFLLYNYQEPAGWGFIALTAVIAISAFVALFRFQNKFRAQGIVGGKDTEMIKPTTNSNKEKE
ncbi:MAG: hypothetical protein Q8T09_07895 [Candidatus Melainabacteria bacterium]|nr:hypothetical protein [Candidatus Melainabacteria bacterium]